MQARGAAGWFFGLGALLLLSMLFSARLGPVSIDALTVLRASLNGISVPGGVRLEYLSIGGIGIQRPSIEWTRLFDYSVSPGHETIVRGIRLPRITLAAIVGFALAAAGTVMQGFFRNPMADPSIIGVSSGAALGAVAFIVLPLANLYGLGLQLAAFTGALIAAFVVYTIATTNQRTPVATLLLAGIAVQTFLGAIISYLILRSGDSMEQAVFWLMGRLHNSTWTDVGLSLPFVLVFYAILTLYARDLNVLLLGEEDAATLGISVERTKQILLAASSVITAAAVAVSGVIGFVGLIVPHMMRLLVGPDHRILLPTSALAGASFLVITDTVARTGAVEVPVGIVTAALGAPFFLYLLRTREVHAL